MRLATLLLAVAFVCGCATPTNHEKLPTVHFQSEREALGILAQRADLVTSNSSQGTITLTRPDGESVRLDLAMVRSGHDKLRIRAWKLGRAVFDLTMNGGDVWLFTPDDPSLKQKARSAGLSARQLAQNIRLLDGGLFRRTDAKVSDDGKTLRVTAPERENLLQCDVDRSTLTPRRYVLSDPAGATRFSMELSDYRALTPVPVPFRMTARSNEGTIAVALREVELNGELAEGAFVPPKRAEKLP